MRAIFGSLPGKKKVDQYKTETLNTKLANGQVFCR